MSEWKSIETAPKKKKFFAMALDGLGKYELPFLVKFKSGILVNAETETELIVKVTFWKPVPYKGASGE